MSLGRKGCIHESPEHTYICPYCEPEKTGITTKIMTAVFATKFIVPIVLVLIVVGERIGHVVGMTFGGNP